MKICIFTETYYPVVGGGETQARLLAEGLVSCGHSVVILTRRSDPAFKAHETYGDVSVYRLSPSGSGQLKKWGLLLSSIPALIKLRNHYDLIFVSGYRIIGLAGVLIGKLLRKRVVLKSDSQGEMSGEFFASGLKKFGALPSSFFFRSFLAFRNAILKKADAFSAISTEIAAEWTSSGIPSNKVHLIPNSVDTTRFTPVGLEKKSDLRNELHLPRDTTIVIYTGRLVSYKGLPLLLEAWNKIRDTHDNTLLILAGTGGMDIHNCEAELREYVRVNRLANHVLFTGVVQNISDYLQASDIFVFPTENEAFGTSLVEAMACGLPVITTPTGAIKTIVFNGENGLVVHPRDLEKLYEALAVMIVDKSLASRLGQAAHQSIHPRFSVNIVNRQYIALFQTTLKSPSHKSESGDRRNENGQIQ